MYDSYLEYLSFVYDAALIGTTFKPHTFVYNLVKNEWLWTVASRIVADVAEIPRERVEAGALRRRHFHAT